MKKTQKLFNAFSNICSPFGIYTSYSAPETPDALCHEAYRVYQHRLCDDDFKQYYLQMCKSTSRAYAIDAVADYYNSNQRLIDTGQIESPKETEENI